MGIPENIDALLVKYDITQDHLARIAGVTSGAISGWRKGSTPRKKNVQAICDYFGLTEDDILSATVGLAAKEHGRFPSGRIPVVGVPMAKVPLVGNTHAGKPCLPEELDEFPEVDVPQFLLDADPASYGLEVDGDCMDRVCPPGMVAVVQPGVSARIGRRGGGHHRRHRLHHAPHDRHQRRPDPAPPSPTTPTTRTSTSTPPATTPSTWST